MHFPSQWGRTRYDDLIRKYKVGKGRLYFILTENDDKVARELKIAKSGVKAFKKRHELILKDHRSRL